MGTKKRVGWVFVTLADIERYQSERQLTKRELAHRFGVAQGSLNNWAKGMVPFADTQQRIRQVIRGAQGSWSEAVAAEQDKARGGWAHVTLEEVVRYQQDNSLTNEDAAQRFNVSPRALVSWRLEGRVPHPSTQRRIRTVIGQESWTASSHVAAAVDPSREEAVVATGRIVNAYLVGSRNQKLGAEELVQLIATVRQAFS